MERLSVQRKPASKGADKLGAGILQRRGGQDQAVDAPPMGPRFGFDFSKIPIHSPGHAQPVANGKAPLHENMRGAGSEDSSEFTNQRFGGESEDPVHAPLLDRFRREQEQPPGGVDEEGNQVGPTDAEIKYRTQPIAVLNGPFHAPIDTFAGVGMEIQITVKSSSGNNADMALVQDSEQVSPSLAHTGCFATVPPTISNTSSFMSAVNIPNDRHTVGRAFITDRADNHGGSGSLAFQQLDIYTDARHGILSPIAIPNSGYRITQTVTAGPGTKLQLTTEKSPEACTVEGFSTAAGPSPAQHDSVVIRP
jgi:hypothetical protein